MRLLQLVATSECVAATRARNEKVAVLAECVAALERDEVALGVAYLSGELPQGRLGVGYATLRAAAPATSAPRASLTLRDVDRRLTELSSLQKRGAASQRRAALAALLALATETEQRFLAKLLLGELRQGALAGVLVEAVAAAARVPADRLRLAAMLGGGLPAVAPVALAQGESGLVRYRIELFRPLEPMLATPAADLEQALARFGRAALEYKLDGARVQVHRLGDDVRVFSRSGKDVSAAVPEIVEDALRLPLRSAVLDGEAIALEPGRQASALSDDDASFRPPQRRRGTPRLPASLLLRVRLPPPRRGRHDRVGVSRTHRSAGPGRSPALAGHPSHHGRRRRGRRVSGSRARGRA